MCRRALVLDAGSPRNAASMAMHGLLSRDGVAPAEFFAIARAEVRGYGVEVVEACVAEAARENGAFRLVLSDGRALSATLVLLAPGIQDFVPPVEGLEGLYRASLSVFVCPYCDGFEQRGKRLAALGAGESGSELAVGLSHFSDDVILFTHGRVLERAERAWLARHGVPVVEAPIARAVGRDGRLEALVLESGEVALRDAAFFEKGCRAASDLARRLGCPTSAERFVDGGVDGATPVEGLYVAGGITPRPKLAVLAAAEGVTAAMAMHRALLRKRVGERAHDHAA